MKKSFLNYLVGGALFLSAPMFTSCQDILGEWDKPTPVNVTPSTDDGGSTASGTYIKYTAPGTSTNEPIGDATKWEYTADATVPAGTYYVDGTVNCTGAITLTGDVNLILKDGATLTIQNGIAGWDDPNTPTALVYSLNVYAQSTGASMGKLVVNNDTPDANNEAYAIRVKSLTVHGGQINATGNTSNAAGISGAALEASEKLTVYDGAVNLTAEGTAAACYTWGSGTDALEFYGGAITAIGGDGTNGTISASSVTIASTITKLEITNTAATGLDKFISANTTLTIGGTDVKAEWDAATTTTIPTTWPITPTYDSSTLTLQP